MLRGQRYDLHPIAGKDVARTDEQDLGPLFHEARKSRVDAACVAGIEDLDFLPNCDGRSSHIRDHRFDDHRIVIRVDEQRSTGGPRDKFSQQPEPL